MNANRKAAQDQILKDLEAISPGCVDVSIYQARFEKMSDKDFEAFMLRLKEGTERLVITIPNAGDAKLHVDNNYALADKWGIGFHHRIRWPSDGDMEAYLTPNEYLVLKVPVRIPSQRLAKKQSIPKHQRAISTMTGQVTGESKGSGISMPKIRLCIAMGLKNTAVELLKYRGGDFRGYAAMNASLSRSGQATQSQLKMFASGVKSTDTLKTILTSAHLKNTL